MNSRQQGDIGVAAAHYHYTRASFKVLLPQTEASRYDLLLERENGEFTRVQCKTTTVISHSCYVVGIRTAGGNQSWNRVSKKLDPQEADLLFVWAGDGTFWEFPVKDVAHKSKITLNPSRIKHCVYGTPKFLTDYEPQLLPRTKNCPDCNALITKKAARCKKCAIRARGRKRCIECDTVIDRRATRCRQCTHKVPRPTKIDWPDRDALITLLSESNYSAVARDLGVSDNALRKHLKKQTE